MKHNAKRLRQVRESMGMTQEKLAILASVSERTVQRAEAGQAMSLETLNDFAAALEMPLSALVIDPDEINSEEPLGLRQVTSPRALLHELTRAGVAVLDCEVDAGRDELAPLLRLVGDLEKRMPAPWAMEQNPGSGSLREQLAVGANIADDLNLLKTFGICLFSSTSWISARYPYWDVDSCCRAVDDWQPYARVMALHLVIARSREERLYRRAPSIWEGLPLEPPAQVLQGDGFDELDEGVPF